MKNFRLHILVVALFLSAVNLRCSTGSNLFQAGSPLISSLASVPNLSTVTSLLQTPGLDKLLGDVMKKPFTFLAPTNEALNSLGAGAVSNLANPSNLNQLADLLKNHIIPGKLDAAGLMQTGLKAVSGKAVELGSSALGSMIGGDKFNIFPVDKLLGS